MRRASQRVGSIEGLTSPRAQRQQADFQRYDPNVVKRGWLHTARVDIRMAPSSFEVQFKARQWKGYFIVLSSSTINVFSDDKEWTISLLGQQLIQKILEVL